MQAKRTPAGGVVGPADAAARRHQGVARPVHRRARSLWRAGTLRRIQVEARVGRVSAEQKAVGAKLKAQGFVYFVVRDLETFQAIVDEYFTPLPG